VIRSLEGQPLVKTRRVADGSSSSQQAAAAAIAAETQLQQQYAPPPAPLRRSDDFTRSHPPPPPPITLHGDSKQCVEYWMPPHSVSALPNISTAAAAAVAVDADGAAAITTAAAAAATEQTSAGAMLGPGSAIARRRLTQLAPKFCGKLGTYVPNYYSNVDGSMFGVSIAPNADGSIIAVGSPLNGPEANNPGGSSVLTSWSDKTCEYAVVPVWQPEGCYKYFGAQVSPAAVAALWLFAQWCWQSRCFHVAKSWPHSCAAGGNARAGSSAACSGAAWRHTSPACAMARQE
jgi:hypothetical protein